MPKRKATAGKPLKKMGPVKKLTAWLNSQAQYFTITWAAGCAIMSALGLVVTFISIRENVWGMALFGICLLAPFGLIGVFGLLRYPIKSDWGKAIACSISLFTLITFVGFWMMSHIVGQV